MAEAGSKPDPSASRVGSALPERRSVFVEDAAALLGVSRRTIYYRIREGRLRTIRTRGGTQRVLIESIEAFRRGGLAPGGKSAGESESEALTLQVEALS
jgi:excisionase family DNA binding protein